MLIHWDWDENCEALLRTPDISVNVSELLRAHRRGHHLVAISRRVVSALGAIDLSQSDRAMLERLAQEYTQTGALHRVSTAYIRVGNVHNAQPQRVGSALVIPFHLITTSRVLETPALLVENVDSDGWLLSQAIREVAAQSGRGVLSFEPYHGGGDDLPNVLVHLIRSGRAAYAIADSDRDSPLIGEVVKLRKMRRILKAANWVAAEGTVLPCREAENLVPVSVAMRLPSALGKHLNAIGLAVQTAEINGGAISNDRYWSFVDLKTGLSPTRIAAMTADDRAWILGKLHYAGLDAESCDFEGYGNGVAHQIEASGALVADMRRAFREKYWRDAFASFFDPVCWFFLATKRVAT